MKPATKTEDSNEKNTVVVNYLTKLLIAKAY